MPKPAFLSRPAEIVFIASAWLLALLVLPGFFADAAELPKLAALAVSTAILAGLAVSRLLVARERAFPATPLSLPLAALLVSATVSLAGSTAPGPGSYALPFLFAMAFSGLMAGSLESREKLLQAMLVSGGIVALYGVGQFVGFEPLSWSSHFKPRIFSTLGNPVFLGGFLAAIFPLAFARWLSVESEEEKDLLTLLLAVLGAALFLTWTRGSWLAVTASTAAQLLALASSKPGKETLSRNRVWLLTLGVIALVSVIILSSPGLLGKNPVPLADRFRDALNRKSYSVQFRLATSEVALRMAQAHPVKGAGIGAFSSWYPLLRLGTRGAGNKWMASQEVYTHNDHLQFLGELGVVGAGLWIWFLLCAYRWVWHRQRVETSRFQEYLDNGAAGPDPRREGLALGALGVVVAVTVDAVFNFPLHIAPTAWIFFVVLGLLAVNPAAPGGPPFHPTRNQSIAASAIIFAFLAAVAGPCYRHIRADSAMREGEGYFSGNNHEMAEVYFADGTILTPLNKVFHFRRSVTLLRAGNWEWRGEALDRALFHGRRAIELGLQEENAWLQLGNIFGRKFMIQRAISALEIAHSINPQREDISNNLAYYLALRGQKPDWAIELARDAVSRAPADPTYNDTLGYTLIRAGRYREAIAPLMRSLTALPANNPNPSIKEARAEVLTHLAAARARQPL